MIDFDEQIIANFRKRYIDLHPLIFHRSLERANNTLELFEILESIPKPPVVWDDAQRSWIRETDFLCKKNLRSMKKK